MGRPWYCSEEVGHWGMWALGALRGCSDPRCALQSLCEICSDDQFVPLHSLDDAVVTFPPLS